MRLFGLIGYPLSHSFSKKFFEDKFRHEGINDAAYELFPIENINSLPELIQSHPDLRGLNVTIPYKQEVLPFLHHTNHLPEGLNACNCIRIYNNKLTGYNTDVTGFRQSFMRFYQPHHNRALILGTGGAAEAVAWCFRQMKIEFSLVSRSAGAGVGFTYDDLNAELISSHTVIVNTTPLGMYPKVHECPPIPYDFITSRHYLFDLVYNPSETIFLQKGKERGAVVQNGAEMLVIQAEESWRIWNS